MTSTEHVHCRTWAVVLNWNQPAMTLDCVRSLLTQTLPVRVLVVDNGSTATNRAMLRDNLPANCEYIQNPQNLGFASGMNVGIRAAISGGAEFVWLMNNDAFPEPQCLSELVAVADANPLLAATSPFLYGTNGQEQHAGGRVLMDMAQHDLLYSDQMCKPVSDTFWLAGTALLIKGSALKVSGGFDTRYFAYWEEVDLLFRLNKLGHYLCTVPNARCLHLGNASTGGHGSTTAAYLNARNAWLFARKHISLPSRFKVEARLAASQIEMAGLWAAKGNMKLAESILKGCFEGLASRFGSPKKKRDSGFLYKILLSHPWFLSRNLLSLFGRKSTFPKSAATILP